MRAAKSSISLLLATLLVLGFARPVLADELSSKVNAVRSPNLAIYAEADRLANTSAASQARAGELRHIDLGSLLGACEAAGEVVGAGSTIDAIMNAFRNSPPHWSIIQNKRWDAMGTGTATGSDGTLYVSVIFCDGDVPTDGGSGSPPTTTAPTTTAPPVQATTKPRPRSRTRAVIQPLLSFTPCSGDQAREQVLHEPPWDTGYCPGLA